MNPDEIIVHVMQRNRCHVVLDLFRERNGEIDWLGDVAIIYNHYPMRLLEIYQSAGAKGILAFGLPQAATENTADSLGAGHGRPE